MRSLGAFWRSDFHWLIVTVNAVAGYCKVGFSSLTWCYTGIPLHLHEHLNDP